MAKLSSVILFLGLVVTIDGLLFEDGPAESEESFFPFIYHNHDIYNLTGLKRVIKDHSVVFLVLPSVPTIELELHNNRLPNHFQIMTFNHDMQPFTEQASTENCFYHGTVSNYEDSFVVIDGCQAPNIKGYISIDGQVLILEPAEDDNGGHILRKHFSRSTLRNFFSSKPLPKKNLLELEEEEESTEEDTLVREPRQSGQSVPPLFIEIYVVCDYDLYEEFDRDNRTLTAKIQMVVEVLKEIYLDFGVYIHLSGISIWTNGNLIRPINNGQRTMFNSFLRWRPYKQLPAHDFPILISGSDDSGAGSNLPASHKSQMCSKYHSGLAIKGVNLDDPVLPSLLARTIGGSLGLLEVDPAQCPCSDPSGCIMDNEFRGWTHGPPTKFSSCSEQHLWNSLRSGRLRCLLNQPAGFILPPRCGDGYVDEGEDCDCGDEEECLDLCCDPTTCTFDYIPQECRPTTQPPPTTESVYPTTTEATTPIISTPATTTAAMDPTTTVTNPTTTPQVYGTTYVEDFVTELDTFSYDLTTLPEEPDRASPAVFTVTTAAATERPLTEDEIRIRRIKDLLGPESIEAPPSLIQGPAGGSLEYFTSGSNVTLPCEVSGLPLPSISWYKDQEELLIGYDPRLSVDDGSMKIVAADARDMGEYYCMANNTHGVVISESVSLSLAFLDSLPFTLAAVHEVNETEPLLLGCQIPDSNPPPEVYWTRDLDTKAPLEMGEGVTMAPTGDLVISSTRPEHSGEYTCVVTNTVAGEVRFTESITVKVHALDRAPAWQYTSPREMMAQRGKPFSLHCIPSGSPIPSVKWEKIFGGAEGSEGKGHGPTFTIPSPQAWDSGQYRCTATNGVGESTEETFNVTVEGSPEWVAKPTDVEIPAGSSHSVYCAADGLPLPDISWLVNGKPAQEEVVQYSHLSFSSEPGSGVFNITDGFYLNVVLQCIAENPHGRLLANAYVNIIAFPARIISPLPPLVSVLEGQDVRIPCETLGAPQPEVYWQVGVKALDADEDGSLFIQAAGLGDANNYYCRARNSYGHEDKVTTLHVRGLTRVAISSKEVSLEEESELILTCQVEHYADSPPEVRWSAHGGRSLDMNRTLVEVNQDMTMSSLLIEQLSLEDAGVYTCTVTTDYDQASDQAYVEVTEKIIILPPIEPGNITTSQSHSGLLVMWESEYALNYPIDSFLVEARNNYYPDQWEAIGEVIGTEDSALVAVDPYVTYWFRVTARNTAGQAVSARSRPVAIPSSTPQLNPADVKIDVSVPGNVTVSWKEMGPLQHAGPKFFYRIRWRPIGRKKWEDHKIRDHTVTEYTFEMDPSDSVGLEVAVKSGNFIGSGPKANFVAAYFVAPTTVAPLIFEVEPPIFSRVMEGRDLRLNCSGVGGKDLQTSWYKDGIQVESDSTNYTIIADGSLLITSFGYEDIGAYVCTIDSSTGETLSSFTNLEIRRKTRVTVLPPELEASESSPIEVFCEVEFDTNVASTDIGWLDPLNNTIGSQSDTGDDARVFRNGSSLIIETVLLSDAGTYTCVAETDEDYAEAPFTLMVEALQPPEVAPQLLVVQIQDPQSLSASWAEVSDEEAGDRVLSYFAVARLRGEVQSERKECYSTTTSCLFLGLTPSLTYEVFVAVRTAVGQGPFSSAVSVTMPEPEPIRPGPIKIDKTRVWAKTLTIRWSAPTMGDPLYGYLLSYKADGSQSTPEKTLSPSTNIYKIAGLEPNTRYIVSIQAYNGAGRGEKVTKIVVTKPKNGQ